MMMLMTSHGTKIMGREPILTIGFGLHSVSSLSRVPRPPQSITTGTSDIAIFIRYDFRKSYYKSNQEGAILYNLNMPMPANSKQQKSFVTGLIFRKLKE